MLALAEAEWLTWTANRQLIHKYMARIEDLAKPVLRLAAFEHNTKFLEVVRKSLAGFEHFF